MTEKEPTLDDGRIFNIFELLDKLKKGKKLTEKEKKRLRELDIEI